MHWTHVDDNPERRGEGACTAKELLRTAGPFTGRVLQTRMSYEQLRDFTM